MPDAAFYLERVTKARARIVAIEDALAAIQTGGVQSYRLATGQSDQMVTKLDLKRLQEALDSELERLKRYESDMASAEAAASGGAASGGAVYVRPGF